jgi:oligosaccharide repeat unit polymerase
MNNLEFAVHFAENMETGIAYGLLALILNLLVMRRRIYSLFDPLLFYTVLSAMGGAVVFYLYHFDLIRPYYFWSYLTTQVAFVWAFLLIPPAAPPPRPRASPLAAYAGPITVLYPLSVVLFVASQLYVYSETGLPIFLESRLEAFAGGTGFGFFNRIIFVTSSVSLCCACYRLLLLRRSRASRLVDYAVVAFCLGVSVVSGSKGALLSQIFAVSLALFYARKFRPVDDAERRVRRFFLIVLGVSFPVAFGTIYLQAGIDDLLELASVVAMRFFQTGEIFFMVYPSDVLARLPDGNGLLALFYSPLGTLRLVSRAELPVNLGLQAFWYHYDTTLLAGPNARHNVFGLRYFGPLLAVVFSFILGLVFGLARNTAYRKLPPSPVGMNVYVLIVGSALFIEQDVAGQAIDYFFSVVLVLPWIYMLSYLISPPRMTRRRLVAAHGAAGPRATAVGTT